MDIQRRRQIRSAVDYRAKARDLKQRATRIKYSEIRTKMFAIALAYERIAEFTEQVYYSDLRKYRLPRTKSGGRALR
jgi:transcriptional antiterminator Rof (Rho-off)